MTDLPAHFKTGGVANANNTPIDNPITDAGSTLGRVLFYDKRMSHGDGVACASCHRQENGFTDPNQFSTGFDGQQTGRHSMGITNAVLLLWWKGVLGRAGCFTRNASIGAYSKSRRNGHDAAGFGRKARDKPTSTRSCFKPHSAQRKSRPNGSARRLLSLSGRWSVTNRSSIRRLTLPVYPIYAATFTAQELEGRNLFHGTGLCSQCHTTHVQAGNAPRNIGLDFVDVDQGAGEGKFKTGSLRNVEVRGTFMHDGRFSSLEEVVEFL